MSQYALICSNNGSIDGNWQAYEPPVHNLHALFSKPKKCHVVRLHVHADQLAVQDCMIHTELTVIQ